MRIKRTIVTAILGTAISAAALVAPATAATASAVTPLTDPWDYWCLPSEVGQFKQWNDVTYTCMWVDGDGPFWVAWG